MTEGGVENKGALGSSTTDKDRRVVVTPEGIERGDLNRGACVLIDQLGKPIVLIPEAIAPEGIALLKERCTCVGPWLRDPEEAYNFDAPEVWENAQAIIVRLARVGVSEIERMPRLRGNC